MRKTLRCFFLFGACALLSSVHVAAEEKAAEKPAESAPAPKPAPKQDKVKLPDIPNLRTGEDARTAPAVEGPTSVRSLDQRVQDLLNRRSMRKPTPEQMEAYRKDQNWLVDQVREREQRTEESSIELPDELGLNQNDKDRMDQPDALPSASDLSFLALQPSLSRSASDPLPQATPGLLENSDELPDLEPSETGNFDGLSGNRIEPMFGTRNEELPEELALSKLPVKQPKLSYDNPNMILGPRPKDMSLAQNPFEALGIKEPAANPKDAIQTPATQPFRKLEAYTKIEDPSAYVREQMEKKRGEAAAQREAEIEKMREELIREEREKLERERRPDPRELRKNIKDPALDF